MTNNPLPAALASIKLLPCPCCGVAPELCLSKFWDVICGSGCGMSTGGTSKTPEEAAARWNRRATLPPPADGAVTMPSEPTEAMYLAAKECTPVTKESPDFRRTVYSIYVCMKAAHTTVAPPADSAMVSDKAMQLICDLAASEPCTNHGLLLRKRARTLLAGRK